MPTSINRRRKYFKNLLNCLFAVTIALLIFWCWVLWVFRSARYTKMYFAEKNLGPTMKYFDSNRNQLGIRRIEYKKSSIACSASFTAFTPLYTWPGSVAGYVLNDKIYKGTSADGSATDVAASLEIVSNTWRGSHFCVQRVRVEDFTAKMDSATCAKGQATCSDCLCSKLGTTKNFNCPVKELRISATNPLTTKSTWVKCSADATVVGAGNVYAWCEYNEKQSVVGVGGDLTAASAVVTLQVELYGAPCMDTRENPKGAWFNYPLSKTIYNGCDGTLGTDTFSRLVDSRLEKDFLFIDNAAINSGLPAAYKAYVNVAANTQLAYLWGRHQIPTTCVESCANFRFYPKAGTLIGKLVKAWGFLKMAACMACVGSSALIAMIVFFVFIRGKPNQQIYMATYAIGLLVLLATIIYLIRFVWTVGSSYNAARDHFKEKEQCIKDVAWRKVITDLYSFTSLAKFKSFSYVFLFLLSATFVGAAGLLGFTLSKLGKKQQPGWATVQSEQTWQ